jgi:SpoVK/Ycf46/Vps4 family AAA+-type ATPase
MATKPKEANRPDVVEDWLGAELNRVWLIAERCLRQFQKAQIRSQPDHPSMAEIEGIFAARRSARGATGGPKDEAELMRALAEAESKIAELRRAAPVGRLVDNLKLRPLELETLMIAVAPHIDAPLADVLAVLRGAPGRRGVDLALVAQLLQLKRADRVQLLDVVDEERPLIAWRIVRVMPPESPEAYGSANYRAIQPMLDVLSVICGRGELSSGLHRAAQLQQGQPTLDDLTLDPEMRERVERLCLAAQTAAQKGKIHDVPWVLMWGPRGVGKTTIAQRVCSFAGRQLLAFNPTLTEKNQVEEMFRRAQREALIRGAGFYVGPCTTEMLGESFRPIVKHLSDSPLLTFFGVETMQPPRIKMQHAMQEIQVTIPSEKSRTKMWDERVPNDRRDKDVDLPVLARAFHLTAGEIVETSNEALELAEVEKNRLVRHGDLRGGIERRLRNELGEVARRLTVTARWEDLVLSPEDLNRVHEFINRKVHADRVYNDWGYGRRISYGRGLVALFSGEPGTGKTMLAGLIAKALDLDVYQVDLAQVVSKWVGETEKQLSRVFDQAERANAVLLFDEADSLFAQRTEVQTSNDRYGNLAVNYLLQRLEQYTGVGVLTTNKDAALDEALQRRLSLHLRLEMPEPPERERLWRSLMLETLPTAKDIDFPLLANEFELTGGYIRNIVLRAAFMAAANKAAVGMNMLRRAAALELEDMGRLVARGDELDFPIAAPPNRAYSS